MIIKKEKEDNKEDEKNKEENEISNIERNKNKPTTNKENNTHVNEERPVRMKRAKTTRKFTRIFLRKESLRSIRQNNINERKKGFSCEFKK